MAATASRDLSINCFQNCFLLLVPFFLASGPETLHLQLKSGQMAERLDSMSMQDLRALDYEVRTDLEHACAAQIVRTVLGARHVARQYATWQDRWQSHDFEFFTQRFFGLTASVDLIVDMVKQGARLSSIEDMFNDAYIPFVVGMNWHWFSSASDATVFHMCSAFTRLPELQGLRAILPKQWPAQAAFYYHEQTMSYTQLSRSDKVVWIRSFSSGCWCCRRHDSANPSGLTTSCPGCTRSHRVCESLAPGTLSLLEYICAQVQVLCEKISPDRLTRSATDSRQHRSKAACHTCDRKTSLSEAYRILLLLHNLGTEIDSIHSDRHIDR